MAALGGHGWWERNYGWSWMVAQLSNAHLENMFITRKFSFKT